MHFTCSKSALIEAIQIATKALSTRTTNPILEGILIETDIDRINLTCTDERMTIVTGFPAEISDAGRGVAPGKLFSEIIRRQPEDHIDINMDDRCVFTIRSGCSRMNIAGQDPDFFPLRPKIDTRNEISLPQDMLRDMIQKTEFAISPDDMREVLTGCLLEIGGGDVNMVALDGYRLALRRAKCSDVLEKVSAIIPGRSLGEIGKLFSEDEEAFATLAFGENNKLYIKLENTEIFCLLVAGEYVQYRQILPKSFATRLVLELDPFKRCIDRAGLIAREGNNNLIMLRISDGTMVIEAHSQIGDFREEIQVEQTGEDINIAFNVRYMSDVVRYIDAEKIEINLNTPVTPCVITPYGDGDYVHLILPVRTGGK